MGQLEPHEYLHAVDNCCAGGEIGREASREWERAKQSNGKGGLDGGGLSFEFGEMLRCRSVACGL
jgi:hypothetical protein